MKNINFKNLSLFLLASLFFLLLACSKGDVFTGSPADSGIPTTKLTGIISSTAGEVVASQNFPLTISLGDNPDTPAVDLLTFPVDTSIEVTALDINNNKKVVKSFILPAGQNSFVVQMSTPAVVANSDFNLNLDVYLSAITTAPGISPVGFAGKQYALTSNTLPLFFSESTLSGANSKRFSLRLDFDGPYGSGIPFYNDLNFVIKKNGALIPSTSNIQGVAVFSSTVNSPLYGTVNSTGRGESINFIDTKQGLSVFNATLNDSINGIYTVKSPSSTNPGKDRPHGFKSTDEVSISNINGLNSAPIVVQVTVQDPYTFTFSTTGSHIFTGQQTPAFYQPVIVPSLTSDDIPQPKPWSPYDAYNGNQSVTIGSVALGFTKYYSKKYIKASVKGENLNPASDPINWTTIKPKNDWATIFSSSIPVWSSSTIYNVNSIVTFNNIVYVCKGDPRRDANGNDTAAGSTNPSVDTSRWTTASNYVKSDVLGYTSTDTYEVSTFAKALNGSTSATTSFDLPYRFLLRYPSPAGKFEIYSSVFNGLTVGTATNATPRFTIVKKTVQGVSDYTVTKLF